VKKLIASALTIALTVAFAAGLCVTVSGCPKSDTKASGTGAATTATGGTSGK
jgi:hypothetical protein